MASLPHDNAVQQYYTYQLKGFFKLSRDIYIFLGRLAYPGRVIVHENYVRAFVQYRACHGLPGMDDGCAETAYADAPDPWTTV